MEHSVFCNCILCKHFAHFKHRLQLFYTLTVAAKTSLRNFPLCCLLFITPKNAAQCLREADNPFTYFPQIRSHPLLGKTLQLKLSGPLCCWKPDWLCLSSETSSVKVLLLWGFQHSQKKNSICMGYQVMQEKLIAMHFVIIWRIHFWEVWTSAMRKKVQ